MSTFSYNDSYLRTRATYPASGSQRVVLDLGWDDSKRMERMKAFLEDAQGGTVQVYEHLTYDYKSPENLDTVLRHAMTDERTGRKTTYSYDKIARLKGAKTTGPGGGTVSEFGYDYDPNSNLTRETVDGAATRFDYNAGNELTCRYTGSSCGGPGTVTYDYDGAGNLKETSEGLSLDYNAKGQTSRVTPPGGGHIPMTYGDADQVRRVRAGDKQFTYSQLGLTGERQGTQRTFFVRDPGGTVLYQRTPQGTHYVVPDALGSTVGLVDQQGSRVATYAYDPYGELTQATGSHHTPLRFAGGYHDAGWAATKFGTRYYQPEVARWTQHDPEFGQIENPLTLNPYLYAGCNPVNVTDPTGRDWQETATTVITYLAVCIQFGIIGAIFALVAPPLGFLVACLIGMLYYYVLDKYLSPE